MYYDFIEEESQKLRVGMIVWISMLAAALIASFERPTVGLLLGIAGIMLAVVNVKAQKVLNGKTSSLKDKEVFFLQLSGKDTQKFKELHLMITRDYVVYRQPDVRIAELSGVREVRLEDQDNSRQLVLLKQGAERCVIASVHKGKSEEKLLEKASTRLCEQISS